MKESLTIIIVNYNSKDFLERCLQSVQDTTLRSHYKIVVVDNASEDQDFQALRQRYPRVEWIVNSVNTGFSAGCNQGIRQAPADFYLLLNPDVMVTGSAIDSTLDFLNSNPQAGIVGCRIRNPDGSLQLAARRTIPTPLTAFYRVTGLSLLFPRSRRLAAYNLTYLPEEITHEVEAVSGSFLMFRDQILKDSGYLDERFFLYGEDLDFCYRARQCGWRVIYFPAAEVLHFKGQSASRSTRLSTFHYYDAMKIFYRKHHGQGAGRIQNGLVVAAIHLLYVLKRLRQVISGRRGVASDL